MAKRKNSTLGLTKPWSWTFHEASGGQSQYSQAACCIISAPSSEDGTYKIGPHGNPIMEPTMQRVAQVFADYKSNPNGDGSYDIESCKKRAQFICDLANSMEDRP